MRRATCLLACFSGLGLSALIWVSVDAAPPQSARKGTLASEAAPSKVTPTGRSPYVVRAQDEAVPLNPLNYAELLEQAREAFRQGDYERAEILALQAQAVQPRQSFFGRLFAKDSPAKVLEDITEARARKQADAVRAHEVQHRVESAQTQSPRQEPRVADRDSSEVSGQPVRDPMVVKPAASATPDQGHTEIDHRTLVRRLLSEARDLIEQDRLSEAAEMAIHAKRIPVEYQPGEQTPDDVLHDVAARRRHQLRVPPHIDPRDAAKPADLTTPLTPAVAEKAPAVEAEPVVKSDATEPSATEAESVVKSDHPSEEIPPGPLSVTPPTEAVSTEPPAEEPDHPQDVSSLGATKPSDSPTDPSPATVGDPTQLPAERQEQLYHNWLAEARRQLAQGNVGSARRWAFRARELNVHRGVLSFLTSSGDSPDEVLEDIVEYQRLEEERRIRPDSKEVQGRHYSWLVRQASRLIDQGDLDLAQHLAQQADDLGARPLFHFGPSPKRLLAQIARQRGESFQPVESEPVPSAMALTSPDDSSDDVEVESELPAGSLDSWADDSISPAGTVAQTHHQEHPTERAKTDRPTGTLPAPVVEPHEDAPEPAQPLLLPDIAETPDESDKLVQTAPPTDSPQTVDEEPEDSSSRDDTRDVAETIAVDASPRPTVHESAAVSEPDVTAAAEGLSRADRSQLSEQWTQQARRHLAQGDMEAARRLAIQARRLGVRHGLFADSPEAVLEDIVEYQRLQHDARNKRFDDDAVRRHYDWLMTQARRLKAQEDYDLAEHMARQADALDVQPFLGLGMTPKRLLAEIAEERSERPQDQPQQPTAELVQTPTASPDTPVTAQETPLAETERHAPQIDETPVPTKALTLTPSSEKPLRDTRAPDAVSIAPEVTADTAPIASDAAPVAVSEPTAVTQHEPLPSAAEQAPTATQTPSPAPSGPFVSIPDASPDQTVSSVSPETPRTLPGEPAEPMAPESPAPPEAYQFYELGMKAMREGDRSKAIEHFQKAIAQADQLDPHTRQQVQDSLVALYGHPVRPASARQERSGPFGTRQPDILSQAEQLEQIRLKKLTADILQALTEAAEMETDQPDEAIRKLETARARLQEQDPQQPEVAGLLRRVESQIARIDNYRQQHVHEIEARRQAHDTEEQIQREKEHRLAVQKEVARLVDQFNELMDQGRYAEAKLIAEKTAEIDPNNPVTQSLVWKATFAWRIARNEEIQNLKEQRIVDTFFDVDAASFSPVGDGHEMVFPDIRTWQDITQRRAGIETAYSPTRSEKELEIERRLRQRVTVHFQGTPLAEAIDILKAQTGINMVLDPMALSEEGIDTDEPITLNVDEVMFKSALNLLLEPLRLKWIIRDEVLKITSPARARGEMVPKVYHVGDLVMPVPNFVNGNLSWGAIFNYAMLGANSPSIGSPIAMATPTTPGQSDTAQIATTALAQMGGPGGAGAGGFPTAIPGGPGAQSLAGVPDMGNMVQGAGGAANADFGPLIDLLTKTIEPESWEDVGGPGSVEEFGLTLSLIITQTQDVHDQIASLLEQLRRLLDLQIAVEVRFITLNDNFFERIGIDFDFDIDDDQDGPFQVFGRPEIAEDEDGGPFTDPDALNAFDPTIQPARNIQDQDHLNGVTVGLSAPGVFSADLDVPFRQGSFQIGIPQFGGFTPDAGAQIGLAILSDIEAFFFLEAAQADRRTNVVQAPKVILFNGQTGTIIDISQQPFLVAVVPLVGAGAVAFQPVIVPIPTGAIVSVTGVISADRRYVRLTVLPFFIQRGQVFTFTTNLGAVGGGGALGGGGEATTIPVTLQLPAFSFTFVLTTVNVPDGGTVLLGGVKRISEGRTEAGVPILNKLPYINRLFKNVGTGRDTQSLMLMVTPRIIIGEEEEELLGVSI